MYAGHIVEVENDIGLVLHIERYKLHLLKVENPIMKTNISPVCHEQASFVSLQSIKAVILNDLCRAGLVNNSDVTFLQDLDDNFQKCLFQHLFKVLPIEDIKQPILVHLEKVISIITFDPAHVAPDGDGYACLRLLVYSLISQTGILNGEAGCRHEVIYDISVLHLRFLVQKPLPHGSSRHKATVGTSSDW